ncbi:hypothetical protein MMC29_005938, partial [Sticta canariensis]|nr:hypothetical protein [Sticta canariensis]
MVQLPGPIIASEAASDELDHLSPRLILMPLSPKYSNKHVTKSSRCETIGDLNE